MNQRAELFRCGLSGKNGDFASVAQSPKRVRCSPHIVIPVQLAKQRTTQAGTELSSAGNVQYQFTITPQTMKKHSQLPRDRDECSALSWRTGLRQPESPTLES